MINFTDLKVIVIGDSGTGKSSFIRKWTKDTFSDTYKATIKNNIDFKVFENEGKLTRIQLWDIAGQEENKNLIKFYANDSHGCIVMTDAVNVKTREK